MKNNQTNQERRTPTSHRMDRHQKKSNYRVFIRNSQCTKVSAKCQHKRSSLVQDTSETLFWQERTFLYDCLLASAATHFVRTNLLYRTPCHFWLQILSRSACSFGFGFGSGLRLSISMDNDINFV